jgi:hypothetical protein
MKIVNLLPDWYRQQQRQKRNLRLHLLVMFIVGVAMVGAATAGRARLAALDQERQTLSQEVLKIGNPEAELQKRLVEKTRVDNIQSAYRELGNTVPMSAVIQQIQNDMDKDMALSRVSIEVHQEPVKGSGFVGDTKHPPRYRDVAHFTVVGISPNDLHIAQLIGKISNNPLFSDCSLNYTRTELLRDYFVRRFEIQMQMDLGALTGDEPEPADNSVAAGGTNYAR